MSPLTPAEAIAVAAILDTHPHPLPHWRTWADRLRTWARTELQTEHEEGEMPSQDRVSGSADGTLEARNEAVPQGAQTPGGTWPLHLDRYDREDQQL